MPSTLSRVPLCGGIAATLGLLLLAAAKQTEDPERGVRILYPAPRSAIAGLVRLIVAVEKAAQPVRATLDGKPLTLTRLAFADTWMIPGRLKATSARVGDRADCVLWTAETTLSPGTHEISAGGRTVSVLGVKTAKTPPPNGWTLAYAHRPLPKPGANLDCASCHGQTAGALDTVQTPAVCAPCHDEASVQLIHGHVPQPLAKCAMCHDPHGATRPKLLVDSKEKLCAKCHGSGHFRG